jgi:hypothetical protein
VGSLRGVGQVTEEAYSAHVGTDEDFRAYKAGASCAADLQQALAQLNAQLEANGEFSVLAQWQCRPGAGVRSVMHSACMCALALRLPSKPLHVDSKCASHAIESAVPRSLSLYKCACRIQACQESSAQASEA